MFLTTVKTYQNQILIFLISILYFLFLSQERLISRDEGFYLYAGQLVAEGKKLYVDFFYPQMPILPIIYGIFFKIFGASWENARILNAIFASLLSLLIYIYINRKFNWRLAILATFLFLTSNYVVAWLTVSQTYAPALLCLVASLYYLDLNPKQKIYLATSAGFLAYAIQIRLFFLALIPIFILHILSTNKFDKKSISNSLLFMICLALFAIPTIWQAIVNWDQFYFNNLGYHLARTNLNPEDISTNKLKVALVALGISPTLKFSAWQLPMLIYSSFLVALILLIRKRIICWEFIILVVIFILNLLPSPSYVQYFSALIPFAIIGTIRLFDLIKGKSLLLILSSIFAVLYIYRLPEDYDRHLKTGLNLIGIMNQDQANHYNLKNFQSITAKLKKECKNNQEIAGFWPGYLVGTNCQAFPGTENHFGIQIAEKLTNEEQKRFQVISQSKISTAIQKQEPTLVLLGKREENKGALKELIKDSGYISIWKDAGVELFRKN